MSETPKFTPGPWVSEPGAGHRGTWVKGTTGEWSALACGDSDERAAANAHLIAAAPELYGALRRIVTPAMESAMAGAHKATCVCNYCAASAALAKAEGRK